ncbi:MAG: glycosyltransferase family 4 protein [Bacteroidales bacterium]|nr:glycosyltransferase family 4 protein [Bacteroidales bacterium]
MNKSICFVIPKFVTFSTGGAEVQVYYLSEELIKRGYRVEIVTGGKEHSEAAKKSPFYNPNIVYYYYKPSYLLRSIEFIKVFLLLLATKSKFYYQRTDYSLTGSVALFCKLFGRKMIYALAHDDETKRNKYKNQLKDYSYNSKVKKAIRKIDLTLVDLLVEYGKSNANMVLAQSNQQVGAFEEAFNRKPLLVHNSIVFNTGAVCEKENIVLWVANFRKVKQADVFFKLAQMLSHTNWKFYMIGKIDNDEADKDYEAELSHVKNPILNTLGICLIPMPLPGLPAQKYW